MIELLSPANGETVSTLTDIQKDFIRNTSFEKLRANDDELVDWLGLKQDISGDNSIPRPVEFKWKVENRCLLFSHKYLPDKMFEGTIRRNLQDEIDSGLIVRHPFEFDW